MSSESLSRTRRTNPEMGNRYGTTSGMRSPASRYEEGLARGGAGYQQRVIDFQNALIEALLKQLKTHHACILQPFYLQNCRSLLAAMK